MPPPPARARTFDSNGKAVAAPAPGSTLAEQFGEEEAAVTEPQPGAASPAAAMEVEPLGEVDTDIVDIPEEAGFVQVSYSKDTNRDQAGRMGKAETISLLNKFANDQNLDICVQPSHGMGGKPFGPIQIYVESYDMAKHITSTMPTATIKRASATDSSEEIEVSFELRAFRVVEELQNEFKQNNITPDFLRSSSVFVELYLAAGWQFKHVHKKFVAQALSKLGLVVIRCSRPQVKMSIEGELKPLGVPFLGDMINVTLTGGEAGSIKQMMLAGALPARLLVMVPQPQGRPPIHQLLTYNVRVGNDATAELKSLIKQFCAECHLYKEPGTPGAPPALKMCVCSAQEAAGPSSSAADGRGRGQGFGAAGRGRGTKRPAAEVGEARSALYASSGAGKYDEACKRFAIGECGRGMACTFKHDIEKYIGHPTVGEKALELKNKCMCQGACLCFLKLAKTIKCQHAKSAAGRCLVLGKNCFFSNCERSLSLLMFNRLAIYICTHPSCTPAVLVVRHRTVLTVIPRIRIHGTRRRVPWHIDFDSTLGYPGEGPPILAEGLLLVTFNANGLRGRRRARLLLLEARKRKVAILFIQEHNYGAHGAKALRRTAEHAGYAACISPKPEDTSRGGTAILLNRDILGLGSSNVQWDSHCNGRVTTVDLALGESQEKAGTTRLMCVYAPASPVSRGLFINTLRRAKVLTRGAIVAGDFNCVPDIGKDVKYPTGSTTKYPNHHAGALEALMARYGLDDMFRLFAGRHAREYSRQGATVFTRLDRIYSAKHESRWVWNDVGTDPSFCRTGWNSDHLAVAARIEPLGQTKRPPPEGRIDSDIISLPHIRKGVERIWKATYTRHKTSECGHSRVWELFTQQVRAYLAGESSEARLRSRPSNKLGALSEEFTRKAQAASQEEPSPERLSAMHRIQRRLEEEAAKGTPAKGVSAWARVMREEISSRLFYKSFKARHANQNINSLYRVNDWADPQARPSRDSEAATGNDVLSEATKYYRWLFHKKESVRPERLLRFLRAKRISSAHRDICDKPITEAETRLAISRSSNNKSPGPDCLPTEFYKAFADMISGELTEVFNEAIDMGMLPDRMLEGEIALLYKKKDPRDIRNYRPITLLNADYKIVAKVMGERLKQTLDSIISPPQTGFVPKRQITDNTHLLKLVQAYLDETDEEGIMVFLDCEKAFDRCSWDYLHKSMHALGYGPVMCNFIRLLTDVNESPRRRIKANGQKGPWFSLQSGVAQGCPLSPILFLFITEGLSRMVLADRESASPLVRPWVGINICGHELRISQFADDTVMLLKNFAQLQVMWRLIKIWEEATGMLLNKCKTEGLRCGRLIGVNHPNQEGIAWCKPGEYIVSLGIPFAEEHGALESFFEAKYLKMRCLLANWHAIHTLTTLGRAMIAGSLIYSRFRYYVQTMVMPSHLHSAIEATVQALVWNRDLDFDPDELGSELTSRRWMRKEAQFRPKRELGLGLLDWRAHVKALHCKAVLQYMNATRGEYKLILDYWLARGSMGRGGICTDVPVKKLAASATKGRHGCLPLFWRKALASFRGLKLTPVQFDSFISRNEARAEPFWVSKRFKVQRRKHMKMWINVMDLRRLQDLYDNDGSAYTARELEEYYAHRLRSAGDREASIGARTTVSYDDLTNQWRSFVASVPDKLRDQVRGVADSAGEIAGVYSAVARKLMSSMGWAGGGLGRHGEGIAVPIEAVGNLGSDRKGLGAKRARTRIRAKAKQTTLRAITHPDEDGDEVLQYGYVANGRIELVELSPRGRPIKTGEVRDVGSNDLLREVAWWGDGILGIAEATYPHPQGWTVVGAYDSPTLDELTVRILTAVFRRQGEKPPSCIEAWTSRLGGAIPWQELGQSFQGGLLTPKDYCSYFKNVLHRALLTRNRKPADDGDTKCRCCHAAVESLSHLPGCPSLLPCWNRLLSLVNEPHSSRAVLLGISKDGHALPLGWRALWLIVWKFVIISFTQIGVGEATDLNEESIWELALRRFAVRVHAAAYGFRLRITKAEASGHMPPNPASINRLLEPLASLDAQGALAWHPTLASKLKSLGIEVTQSLPKDGTKKPALLPIKFVKQSPAAER